MPIKRQSSIEAAREKPRKRATPKGGKKATGVKAVKVERKKLAPMQAPEPDKTPKVGRPPIFTQDLADRICKQLIEGESLRAVCRKRNMPGLSTVCEWLNSMPKFAEQYARATQERADMYAEEINELGDLAIKAVSKLSDDSKKGNAVVQAYKLKADNLKWNAARMKPKKYGDRINVATDDDEPENPYEGLDEETLRKLAQEDE